MQLAYCYIKDYKSLKKEEFNFIPGVEFKINWSETREKENTYHLNKKENGRKIPEEFFGKNISNVTAIIGENGTGKTSLLEVIFNQDIDVDYFLIIKSDKGYELYSNGKDIEVFLEDKIKLFKIKRNFNFLKLDNLENNEGSDSFIRTSISDSNKGELFRKINKIDLSSNAQIIRNDWNFYKYYTDNQKDIMRFLIKYRGVEELEKRINIKLPRKFIYTLNKNSIKSIESKIKNLDDFYDCIIDEFFLTIGKGIQENEYKEKLKKEITEKSNYFSDNELLEILERNSDTNKIEHNFSDFIPYVSSATIQTKIEKNKKKIAIKGIVKILAFYKNIYLIGGNSNTNFKLVDNKLEIFLKNTKEAQEFVKYLDFIDIKGEKNYDHNFKYNFDIKLSSGEKNMLSIFSRLYIGLYSNNVLQGKKNIVLFLDEIDSLLHPEWQRKIFKIICDFLNNREKKMNIQILVTSHSPFIVSDLPKENIIMFKKVEDENGKTKVEQKVEKQNTFAGNIFDLYSNLFFTTSNLGEFSKEKIEEIIKYLNNLKNVREIPEEEIEFILDSIGEPLIQNRLQKMYKEYRKNNDLLTEEEELARKFKNLSLEKKKELLEKEVGE